MPDADHGKLADKLYQDVITGLTILKKNIGIYPQGHTAIARTTDHLLGLLQSVFENSPHITIVATKKMLTLNGHSIESKSPHVHDFALFLNQRGIASLTLERGLAPEHLQQFYGLALAIPPGSQLYQQQEIEEAISALEHISVRQLDFSGVLFTDEEGQTRSLASGNAPSLWQEFMLSSLGPEHEHNRDSILEEMPDCYERESFKQFCLKYNVTPGRLIAGYEEFLQENFLAVEEQSGGAQARREFFLSLVEALDDFSSEMKDKLVSITLGHMNTIRDEAAMHALLRSMPAEMLRIILENLDAQQKEISPALTNLLKSMSRTQEHAAQHAHQPEQSAVSGEQLETLFNKERYEEYVSDDYADILQKISAGLLAPEPDRPVSFNVEEYLQSLQDAHLNSTVARAFLALAGGEVSAQVYADLAPKIADLMPELLHGGEYGLLLTVYKTFAEHAVHKKEPEARNAALSVLKAFTEDRCVSILEERFSTQQGRQNPELEELVMLAGARNLTWLLKIYMEHYNAERGRKVFVMLSHFGLAAAEEAVKLLPGNSDEQSIALLKLIQVCGDTSCILQIRKMLESSNTNVRMETLRTLLKIKDPSAVAVLRKMLYAKNEQSLNEALNIIQQYRVQDLAGDLVGMIKIMFIPRDDLARNKAVLSVLGTLGNAKVVSALHKKAFARFSFTPLSLRQTQVFLYKTLAGYPLSAVEQLVQRGMRSSNQKIRSLSEELAARPQR